MNWRHWPVFQGARIPVRSTLAITLVYIVDPPEHFDAGDQIAIYMGGEKWRLCCKARSPDYAVHHASKATRTIVCIYANAYRRVVVALTPGTRVTCVRSGTSGVDVALEGMVVTADLDDGGLPSQVRVPPVV